MYVDRDIDRLMPRTQHRPLVTGAVTPAGRPDASPSSLEVVAFAELWALVNLLAAVPGPGRHPLLRLRVHALAEAHLDPEHRDRRGRRRRARCWSGWAAVTGSLGWTPVVLFAVIFFWTPPHFWALAIRYADDYRGRRRADAARRVARSTSPAGGCSATRSPCGLLPSLVVPVAGTGWIYGGAALVLGAVFIWSVLDLCRASRRPGGPCGCSATRSPTSRCCSAPSPSTRW